MILLSHRVLPWATVALGVLLTCGTVAAPASAAPLALPCAPGTPVTGDYNGDGAADLAVSVEDNWVDESLILVSSHRTNSGTWLKTDAESITSADLNGDVCSDAILAGWSSITVVPGTTAGLDLTRSSAVVTPQATGLDADERVMASASASDTTGSRSWWSLARSRIPPTTGAATRSSTCSPWTPEVRPVPSR